MVENLTQKKQKLLGIATTGILGPASDNTHKPIGLVYIAIHYNNNTSVKKLNILGTRNQIKAKVIIQALKLCLDQFEK